MQSAYRGTVYRRPVRPSSVSLACVRSRRVFFVTSVLAVTACGLSAVGEFVDGTRSTPEAGADGPFLLPDGATADAAADGDADAGDPQALCLEVCDAGGCDAGTCVIECNDAAAPCTTTDAVKCPPGVPCSVQCGAVAACKVLVDCAQASRCEIACTGTDSCEGPIVCAGSDCHVTCGLDASPGPKTCKGSVSCSASNECAIDCISDKSCQGGIVVSTDGGARVNCSAFDSCKDIAVRARDASIFCGADDTCEGVVTCADAGSCAFDCNLVNDKTISLCCPDGGCTGDSGACTGTKLECK